MQLVLSPALTQNQPSLDGLAQPDFVCEDDAVRCTLASQLVREVLGMIRRDAACSLSTRFRCPQRSLHNTPSGRVLLTLGREPRFAIAPHCLNRRLTVGPART